MKMIVLETEDLSEKISCCLFIKTFLIKSLEDPQKEILMFGYLTKENQIKIENFKKLPILN